MERCAEYYCYHLMMRRTNLMTNPVHLGGRLFQQLIVDWWAQIENNTLNYQAQNQQALRADTYQGAIDALHNGDSLSGRRILASSFTGGPRYMSARYQDAMAIVRKVGNPSFFITVTCNPKWVEIQRALLPGQAATDRPDIVARVFKSKLDSITDDLNSIFGRCVATIYSVEFQKRGLPHAHILLCLAAEDRQYAAEHFDEFVSAELPCPTTQPGLYKKVMEHMVHKPCHLMQECVCKNANNVCRKQYPKPYQDRSFRNDQGYPVYRRREGPVATKWFRNVAYEITNKSIVPYNAYLLQKYNCHINVEVCSTMGAVKYLFKYIYKGADRGVINVENDGDEIRRYKAGRYISPVEAAWRIFAFPLHYQTHSVSRLPVHLPNMHIVRYHDEENLQSIVNAQTCTKLIDFFRLCRENYSTFRHVRYPDVSKHCVWRHGRWQVRVNNASRHVSRMYAVSPMEGERYYLRMLLNVVPGPRSFADVRTYNGVIYGTFKAAAIARNLLSDDTQNEQILEEASSHQMPSQLRQTFAGMLLFNEISSPVALWDKFLPHFTDDLRRNYAHVSEDEIVGMTAFEIDQVLRMHEASIDMFITGINLVETIEDETVQDAIFHLDNVSRLTEEQREIFDAVMRAVSEDVDEKLMFLDAPGGCGKTFLYNALAAHLHNQGKNVISVAASAVAASLLTNGNTAHSYFRIPLNAVQGTTCNIAFNSRRAEEIRSAALILFDEAPMASKYTIEAIDLTLQDIFQCGRPFGGLAVLLGGDFRQTLPVVPNGSRPEIVDLTLKSSYLWSYFYCIHLRTNMRTHNLQWNEDLLRIGDGTYPVNDTGLIRMPRECNVVNSISELMENVYPGLLGMYMEANLGVGASTGLLNQLTEFLMDRVILTPTNAVARSINDRIVGDLPGEQVEHLSADTLVELTNMELVPLELLNSMQPSGMPPHCLVLKPFMPVILLRNINKKAGLCNGTRLIVEELHQNHIKVRIASGKFKGNVHFLFRIFCTTAENRVPYRLKRFQFPIVPCFAMTINKSQGQTLTHVGVCLDQPVFSHGQLYVALSRCSDPAQLHVMIPEGEETQNVVFEEIL